MKKSLLDWFHNLNLQPPIKQVVVAGMIGGGFLFLVAIVNGLFSLAVVRTGKPPPPQAQLSQQVVKKHVSPYDFAQAVIQSLGFAHDARQTLLSIQPKGDRAADALESMTNARLAINKLRQAQGMLQRFSGSDDEPITMALQGFDSAYSGLISVLNESILIEERLLSISNEKELGALLNDASKSAAQADESWKLLMYATTAATYALIDYNRTENGKTAYLAITTAQRGALLKDLESYFGESVKIGATAGQYPTDVAPALLWGFLHGEGWKTSDSI